jgi:hypothetical protein
MWEEGGVAPLFFSDETMTMNQSSMDQSIAKRLVPEAERMAFVDQLFGTGYVLKLEPTVFGFAERLANAYRGGYWEFYELSNGGFYMAPRVSTGDGLDGAFHVSCDNGFEGQLSADALGITACLYAYSHLSFGDGVPGTRRFTQVCADQYHLLRVYMFGHPEVAEILGAVD